jgi:hypothetical protein
METITTYRGRPISESDIAVIRQIILIHPDRSRRFISQEVCGIWNWRQTNDALKEMVCRSLLLLLESKDLIKLAPRKSTPPNPLAHRKQPLLKKAVYVYPLTKDFRYRLNTEGPAASQKEAGQC